MERGCSTCTIIDGGRDTHTFFEVLVIRRDVLTGYDERSVLRVSTALLALPVNDEACCGAIFAFVGVGFNWIHTFSRVL